MSERKSIMARWDKKVLQRVREIMPGVSDAERSRTMFKTSLIGVESSLRQADKVMSEAVSRKPKMNRKGSILDVMYLVGVVFAFAVMILIGAKIGDGFNTQVQTLDDLTAGQKTTINTLQNNYYGAVDNSLLFLTIGLGIVTLILAALVKVHPIFIPIFLIAMLLVIMISAVASNAYEEMASNSELSAIANQLTFTGLILTYFPIIIGVFSTLLMIVMYKTWSVD